jgi:hypothetical protein
VDGESRWAFGSKVGNVRLIESETIPDGDCDETPRNYKSPIAKTPEHNEERQIA